MVAVAAVVGGVCGGSGGSGSGASECGDGSGTGDGGRECGGGGGSGHRVAAAVAAAVDVEVTSTSGVCRSGCSGQDRKYMRKSLVAHASGCVLADLLQRRQRWQWMWRSR